MFGTQIFRKIKVHPLIPYDLLKLSEKIEMYKIS